MKNEFGAYLLSGQQRGLKKGTFLGFGLKKRRQNVNVVVKEKLWSKE